MNEPYVVHGADESYYTGKLEAYLRAKGLAYRNEPFGLRSMRRIPRLTGVAQVPQVECPDGSWLVDTTLIIAHLEERHPEPRIAPRDPALGFVSRLLEDYADEWLWRPAMHYRWSYPESARLLSGWLSEHLKGVPLPGFAKRAFWRLRQRTFYVRRDGVTRETWDAVESHYLDTLDTLETIFQERPYLLGERPCEADFGFFASLFRHFACDPTPGRIMRARAPGVNEWVARMWNGSPPRFQSAPEIEILPKDLQPLLRPAVEIYLPYLLANEGAHARGEKRVRYSVQDVEFDEPVKPYRVWCLERLRGEWTHLDGMARAVVEPLLCSPDAVQILDDRAAGPIPDVLEDLPIRPDLDGERKPVDSWWRS